MAIETYWALGLAAFAVLVIVLAVFLRIILVLAALALLAVVGLLLYTGRIPL